MENKEYQEFLGKLKKGCKIYKEIIQRRIDNMPEEDKHLCETYCPNIAITHYTFSEIGNWKLFFFENNTIILATNDKTDITCDVLVSETITSMLPIESKVVVSDLPIKKGDTTIHRMKIEDLTDI